MRSLAAPLIAAAVAGCALLSVAVAVERRTEPCQPGFVKTVVREAGSCLGDYKNRVANEPIAFCTIKREVCVPKPARTPVDATPPAKAPETVQP